SQFWLDEAEPEMRPYSYDNIRLYLGNGLEVANIYPFYYAEMVRKGMIDATGEEPVSLIRSAWLGSQREGIVLWSGDIPSTFESLSAQIKAALNVSLSGIPWWTSDIGGFRGGDPANISFRELMVRWFQFGVFCPVLRMHGKRKPYDTVDKTREYDAFLPSSGPNEIWSFGSEAEGIFRSFISLREKLRPYISREMKKTEMDGRPLMRPLFFDVPGDERAWQIEDQYYFGDDIIVAPVVKLGERERKVYLTEGVWTSGIDGASYSGPLELTVAVPLSKMAFFLRKGSEVEKEIIE
ncbi:MAG: TIM-barrel domain-containing protein, partial [Candidatus Ornithospirochaeta sp.]